MNYDDTTTLEISWKQFGQELKSSFTDENGIVLPEALEKTFGFLQTAYGYCVLRSALSYIHDHLPPDEDA